MSGRQPPHPPPPASPGSILGVDLGPEAIVVAVAQEGGGGIRTLALPGLSEELVTASGPVSCIPALVHYAGDGSRLFGDAVTRAGLRAHPSTARWIRGYLLEESPVRIPAGEDQRVTYRDAASDLLGEVLARAAGACPGIRTVAFALPPGSPAWYPEWLGGIARTAGIPGWYAIDECSAAAAGYGLAPGEGRVLILRFDETGLAVSLARNGSARPAGSPPIHETVEAADDTAGTVLDGLVAREIVAMIRRKSPGRQSPRIAEQVAGILGDVYLQLAAAGEAEITVPDPATGGMLAARVSSEDLARVLPASPFPALLDRTLARARGSSEARGWGRDGPAAVLLLGGRFAIPAMQDLVRARFPGVCVRGDRPHDAIACGAACSSLPCARPRGITRDYALRYWDADAGEHRYRFLVRAGARFPSAGQVARVVISATYDGQARLGIPLYAIGGSRGSPPGLELVSDEKGGVRLAGPPADARAEGRPVPVNGKAPVLLEALPPAKRGEPRFELRFIIDGERRLCVTARDLVTGALVRKDAPVHTLD